MSDSFQVFLDLNTDTLTWNEVGMLLKFYKQMMGRVRTEKNGKLGETCTRTDFGHPWSSKMRFVPVVDQF